MLEIVFSADENRRCGDCTLCCKLLPTKEIEKPANERCPHQKVGKGCTIYHRRPFSCRVWNCRWLVGDDTAELSRPDRAHYVIDIMPDYITIRYDSGKVVDVQVVQIWCDPKFPEAHRDPKLRAYMLRRGAQGIASQVRFDSMRSLLIFPPNMSEDGQWHEKDSRAPEAQLVERTPVDTLQHLATGMRW